MYSKGKADFIGVISLLIGIVSIILSIAGFFLPILPIIGIIFGVIHYFINRTYGETGIGKAGIAVNIGSLIIVVVWFLIIVALFRF